MSMDSFGFDFAGGDILDLGSLGMWGGSSTPMGSSPNSGAGAGNGGLPFSVGTPTGVQSLGDEPFAGLSAASADDFSFGDSPKLDRKSGIAADDLASPYFGADLEAASTGASAATSATTTASSSAGSSAATSTTTTTVTSATADDKAKAGIKMEAAVKKDGPSAASKPSKMSASPGAGVRSSGVASSTNSTASSAAGPPSASTTSAARPHINGPHAPSPGTSVGPQTQNQNQAQAQQQQQQQQQQRYQQAQMMMGQQQPGGFPGAPQPQQQGGYAMHPHMAAANGQQFMAAGPPQAYARPPSSTYEEEFMRVKAMMMQHPDLIPPPMEVLRISMSQSSQGMMGSYMQQQQQRAGQIAMNRGYPPYGNMMMAQQQNPAVMMNPAAARMNPQMAAAAAGRQQQRTPGAAVNAGNAGAAGGTAAGGGASDTPTAWQSENDLPLRRKMIGKMCVPTLCC